MAFLLQVPGESLPSVFSSFQRNLLAWGHITARVELYFSSHWHHDCLSFSTSFPNTHRTPQAWEAGLWTQQTANNMIKCQCFFFLFFFPQNIDSKFSIDSKTLSLEFLTSGRVDFSGTQLFLQKGIPFLVPIHLLILTQNPGNHKREIFCTTWKLSWLSPWS